MKLLKQLSLAVVAVALAGTASAQTVIHIVGSTAFRAGTTISIIDAIGGATPTTVYPGTTTRTKNVYIGANNAVYTSAGQQVFADGYLGSVDPNPGNDSPATTIVVTSWTGSLAGVVDLTIQTTSAAFLDYTNSTVISNVNSNIISPSSYVPANGNSNNELTALASGTTTTTSVDMAMSDAYEQTVADEVSVGATISPPIGGVWTTGAQIGAAISGGTIIQDAGTSNFAGKAGKTCCIPFQWVFTNYTSAAESSHGLTPPTNVTQQMADQLLGAGYVPQSLWTGTTNTGDLHNWGFFTGRNEDSGTRILYLMEPQFGVTASPVQWYFPGSNYENGTSPTNSIATAQPFPIVALNTEPNMTWNTIGHSGYASGGDITPFLKVAQTGNVTFGTHTAKGKTVSYAPADVLTTDGVWYISSLGLTDAATVTAAGGLNLALSYNGVPYSPSATQSGAYTHWGYEHCYRLQSPASTAIGAFIDNVADILYAGDCDVVYVPTATTINSLPVAAGGYHTELSNGSYTLQYGLAPGLKLDANFKAQRTLTEGGAVSSTF